MTVELQLAEEPDERDREAVIEAHADRVAERKLDGVRAYTEDGRLYTRSGNDVTASFPDIHPPDHHVFDGEIVAVKAGGFDFDTALRRVQTEDTFTVDMLSEKHPARLIVFDALVINGGDVTDEPLTERQSLIGPSLPDGAGLVQITTHDDPFALWNEAMDKGWEGVMLKNPDAPYRGGRSSEWLKVKDWNTDTFPVIGHEQTDDGGFVIYVEIGTDEPQKVAVQHPDDRAMVEGGIDRAEVQFLERSVNDRLRKPSFKGVA